MRAELDAARDRRGELAAEQARLHSDMLHLADTCVQELSTPREELMGDESVPRIAGDELTLKKKPTRTCAPAWKTWVRST